VDDIDLKNALFERSHELDRVASVHANYSTTLLAMGTVEGVLGDDIEHHWQEFGGGCQRMWNE
jgi:hypothetical protein